MAASVDVSSSVVFNSLLCFVRTKFKTLEMSRIKSTIVDFFSAEYICSAKRTLLESVSNLVMDKPLPRYPRWFNCRTFDLLSLSITMHPSKII